MNSETNTQALDLKKQIDDYDVQIVALSKLKAQTQKEYNNIAPKVLDQMHARKRNFNEKTKEDFDQLNGLLSNDKVYNVKHKGNNEQITNDTEEIKEDAETEELSQEIRKRVSVIVKRRNVYSNQTKQSICLCIEEYGYAKVHLETGISVESLKTIKKNFNKTGCKGRRGRKVRSPELDIDIKN